MVSNFEIVINKLEIFIKKYYKNLIIKGLLFSFGIIGSLFLLFVIIEYFGYFPVIIRAILYYTFIFTGLIIFIKYTFIPVFKLFRIGHTLSHEDAAKIVGNHFKGVVDDKIVNSIQLYNYLKNSDENINLLIAGINQKTETLIEIKFNEIIKYKDTIKFLYWTFIPLFVITILAFSYPLIIYEPVSRIINFDQHYEKPAPFRILFGIESLIAFQNEDFILNIETQGNSLPENIDISYNNVKYNSKKIKRNLFEYRFNNLQNSKTFYIAGGGYSFGPFNLNVVPKPVINSFRISVVSPEYTNIEKVTYSNFGDISTIYGSEIEFMFHTRFTKELRLIINQIPHTVQEIDKGVYKANITALKDFEYKILSSNEFTDEGDSLKYSINVFSDKYPEIDVTEHKDSIFIAHRFFQGEIRDDFGFTELNFVYGIKEQNEDKPFNMNKEIINIDKITKIQNFYHILDLRTLLKKGQTIEAYFEVWDNDEISGPKMSVSQRFYIRLPDLDDIVHKTIKDYENIKDEIGKNVSDIIQSRDDIQQLKRRLLDNENVGWEERTALQELIYNFEEMQNKIDDISEKKKHTEKRYDQLKKRDEDTEKIAEELENFLDNILSEELEDLLQKIKEELDKLSRDEIYEMLEKVDFEMKHFEIQLDRMYELFKMLEFRNLLNETIDKVDYVKDNQEDLIEEQKNKEFELSDVELKQETIKEDFEQINDMLDQLKQNNSDLLKPQRLPDVSNMQHNIDYDLQKALDEMMNEAFEQSLFHQDRARNEMNNLSNALQNFQQSLFQEDLAEDVRLLRQLLENLIKTSFNQEDLIEKVKRVNINDPRYIELVQEQRKIISDLRVIEDSLIAISKRQVQIESFITREIAEINLNIERVIQHLIDRRRLNAAARQQFVMTHVNNLALLLNESLMNMQMQMAMQMGFDTSGDGNQGSFSLEDIIGKQEEANKMLEQLRQMHSPIQGEGSEGESISESLARMSAQQEAIRNELRKLTEQIKRENGFNIRELESIQNEMQQTELDIVKNEISQSTIMRQQRLLTRLLEHHNALMQRELEDIRVGELPEFYDLSNPDDFFEYNRLRIQLEDELKIESIKLNRYYNDLLENYILNLN